MDIFVLNTIITDNITSGILNTLEAREMLMMKTNSISHVLMLKFKCVSCDRSM